MQYSPREHFEVMILLILLVFVLKVLEIHFANNHFSYLKVTFYKRLDCSSDCSPWIAIIFCQLLIISVTTVTGGCYYQTTRCHIPKDHYLFLYCFYVQILHHVVVSYIIPPYTFLMGWDSTIGIATRYGLDGPGIKSRWGRHFPHPSRPALGPTQPPV